MFKLILLLAVTSSLHAQTLSKESKGQLDELINNLDRPEQLQPKVKCPLTEIVDEADNTIDLSVLSMEYAKELFAVIAKDKKLPLNDPDEADSARAQYISRFLDKQGVVSAKIMSEGDITFETKKKPTGFVKWKSHVSNLVIVKENGKEVPYVLDPALFTGPVPQTKWEAAQKNLKTTSITSRYHYSPRSKTVTRSYYFAEDVLQMEKDLERMKKIEAESLAHPL
jgi:hypothetical protein